MNDEMAGLETRGWPVSQLGLTGLMLIKPWLRQPAWLAYHPGEAKATSIRIIVLEQ